MKPREGVLWLEIDFINIDARFNIKEIIRRQKTGRATAEEAIQQIEVEIVDWEQKWNDGMKKIARAGTRTQ